MREQTFGFNVNKVSYEGADSVFNALASNAMGKAKVAEHDSAVALSESNRALSAYQRYFDASQNTMARSVQEASGANEALTSAYRNQQAAAIRTMNYNAKASDSVLEVVNESLKLGLNIKATQDKADLVQGRIDGMRKAEQLRKEAENDPHGAKADIEGFLTTFQGDPNNAYNKGMAQALFPLYHDFSVQAKEDDDALNISSYLYLIEEHIKEKGKIDPNARVTYAKAHNLPVSVLRDAEYRASSMVVEKDVAEAKSPEDLEKALVEWETFKKENFDNNYFIRSKNEQTQKLISDADRALRDTVKDKYKQFKVIGEDMWVQIMNDPTNMSQASIDTSLNYQQLSPLNKESKIEAYVTANKQASIDLTFQRSFTPTNIDNKVYWEHVSTEVKKAAEIQIGDMGTKLLLDGSPGSLNQFEEIMHSQQGHTQEVGAQLYHIFANGNSEVKALVYDRVNKLLANSDMGPYISQSIGDSELARIITAGTLVDIMGGTGEDMSNAWNNAMKQVSTADLERGLKLQSDKDFYDDVISDAAKMGENSGRFLKVIQTLYAANPDVADKKYDSIQSYFNSLQKQTEVTGVTGNDYKVTEFTSHGPDHFKVIPEKYRDEVKASTFDRVTAQLIDDGKNFDFTTVDYLPGGLIVFKDSFNNPIDTIDVSKYVEEENVRVLEKEANEYTIMDDLKRTLEEGNLIAKEKINEFLDREDVSSVIEDLAKLIK